MCAIVDTNVLHEVFSNDASSAGDFFFKWLTNKRRVKVVLGGKLRREMPPKWQIQYLQLQQSGLLKSVSDEAVDEEETRIRKKGFHVSDDAHVLALAQASGARLLYTNDLALQKDFKNQKILRNGKVFTTRLHRDVRPAQRKLLRRNDLCAS